jgi:hypothetical protein
VGKDGDLEKLLFRWFNRKAYFKRFRDALIARMEGLFALFACLFVDEFCA